MPRQSRSWSHTAPCHSIPLNNPPLQATPLHTTTCYATPLMPPTTARPTPVRDSASTNCQSTLRRRRPSCRASRCRLHGRCSQVSRFPCPPLSFLLARACPLTVTMCLSPFIMPLPSPPPHPVTTRVSPSPSSPPMQRNHAVSLPPSHDLPRHAVALYLRPLLC